jgi:hypothetical protein
MKMARYALVDSNNLVTNVIEWDGSAQWSPPKGATLLAAAEHCTIGATWDGQTFIPPPELRPPAMPMSRADLLEAEINALKSRIEAIEGKAPLTRA